MKITEQLQRPFHCPLPALLKDFKPSDLRGLDFDMLHDLAKVQKLQGANAARAMLQNRGRKAA